MNRLAVKPESYPLGQCFESSIGGNSTPVNLMLVLLEDGKDCAKPPRCADYVDLVLIYVSGYKSGRKEGTVVRYYNNPDEVLRFPTSWIEQVFPIMRQLWPIQGPFIVEPPNV